MTTTVWLFKPRSHGRRKKEVARGARHETIDASDTSASRTWGPCRPASPNTSSEASYEARNETEECLGKQHDGRSVVASTVCHETPQNVMI